jgi:hypothetical protein
MVRQSFVSSLRPSTCDPARGNRDTSRRQVGPRRRSVDRGSSQKETTPRGTTLIAAPAPFPLLSVALLPSAERAAEPVAREVVLRVHPT